MRNTTTKHHYIYMLSLAMTLLGCSSDPIVDDPTPDPEKPYLRVEELSAPFSASGGTCDLHFSTNEPWSISVEAAANDEGEWFTVTPMQGEAGEKLSVTIRADENTAYEPRSFTLTIRTTSLEESLTVTQLKRNAIIAGENRYELSSEEQTLAVEIQANVEYEVEIAEGGVWIVPTEGTRAEPGLTSREHRFTVAANTQPEERQTTIVFRDAESGLQDEVTVVQAAWVDPDPERAALMAIYREAGGQGWTHADNWGSDRPLGEWYGVETDDEGHVVELRLPHNNLCGGLAHEIASLTYLRILDLSYNELGGYLIYELPLEYTEPSKCDLDDLKQIEEIDLSHNKFESETGATLNLQDMPQLRKVDLSYNELGCWVSYSIWAPLFENGRAVDLIFNGNRMYGDVDDFIQNHPEWDRLALQMVRQYYPYSIDYDKDIHVPDFTFTDLRDGTQRSIRDVCGANVRTMVLAWDPTDEGSIRFAERSVRRYHTLYGAQGFAVVAIIPEGEEYRQAAEQYLATHEVAWPVVAEYADAQGRRIVLPTEPYPSYLMFDRDGKLVDDIHNEKSSISCYYPGEPPTFDLAKLEFQYANYMNKYCYDAFGDCTYESKDYSMNKQTELLQRATKGKGIDIVLMGEVFTDIDIETGFYKDAMEFAMEAFFSVEPTKSYREYFNVHMVYAVSKKRQLSENWNDSALKTVSGGTHGIVEYIKNVDEYLSEIHSNSQTTFPSIIINADNTGVTFMEPSLTYAYIGLPYNGRSIFCMTFRHESIGHGFGLLGDEYSRNRPQYPTGEIPAYVKNNLLSYQRQGRFLNISVTNNPQSVPWAHLIGHPRYPNVGIYEGGYVYDTGVWRSEENSIMNTDINSDFNAFCRELIVKRILTLAGEEYTFEKFLEKDVVPTTTILNAPASRKEIEFRHCPPIFMDKN